MGAKNMSLPDNKLYLPIANTVGVVLVPDTLDKFSQRLSYERGGTALSDPEAGLEIQNWSATWSPATTWVTITPETGAPTDLIQIAGLTSLSLSFDQNMRPALAYEASGQSFLYWYDPTIPAFTTTSFGSEVTSPVLSLDDKRRRGTISNRNDILLFYFKGASLYCRQQRDRYTIERWLATFSGVNNRIVKAGMNDRFRVQVEVFGPNNTVIAASVP